MVVGLVGRVRKPVHEAHRLREILEPKAALERSANLVPAFREASVRHAIKYPSNPVDAFARMYGGMRRIAILVALTIAVAVPSSASGATFYGKVFQNGTITFTNASGAKVTRIRAGVHTVIAVDRATSHNYVLHGYGVHRSTGAVGFTGRRTWSVRFYRNRTYTYYCTPHSSAMRGSFRTV
jgi:plastocyanin